MTKDDTDFKVTFSKRDIFCHSHKVQITNVNANDLVQHKHVDVRDTKIIYGPEWFVLYVLSCYMNVLTCIHLKHAWHLDIGHMGIDLSRFENLLCYLQSSIWACSQQIGTVASNFNVNWTISNKSHPDECFGNIYYKCLYGTTFHAL